MILVDANVVLRHLLNDHPDLSPRARELLGDNDVSLRFEVLCEVVYVLEKVYGVPGDRIHTDVVDFIATDSVRTEGLDVARRALALFRDERIDIVDAILCGFAEIRGTDVLTFDKKITRLLSRLTTAD